MRKILSTIFCLLTLTLSSCTIKPDYYDNDDKVIISVEESEYYTVKSQNPQQVEKGSEVKFKIEFNEDYTYKSSSSGYFENNYLIVPDVQYSQTIQIQCALLLEVFLNVSLDDHFSVTSANPVKIKEGSAAIFDVDLDDGYYFVTPSNCEYHNNQLIFYDIYESTIVSVDTAMGLTLTISNDNTLGTIEVTPKKTYYNKGESITLSVSPLQNNQFICFSSDKEIHKPNDSGKPVSFKSTYSFEIEENIHLVANYHNSNDYLMNYSLNGGLTFEGEEELTFDYRLFGKRIRPNSLLNDSYFIRQGYFLESYNTKQDGSGIRIGIGSRIDTELFDENKNIRLYCIWLKESNSNDFEFELINNQVSIIGYSGTDKDVVIPEKINDKNVISIKAQSFKNIEIRRVYVANTIKTIEENAFVNSSLEEIHFWTSLECVSDTSFIGCDNLTTIAINCSTYPKYLNSFARGNFADKLDHAELLAKDGPTILGVGSSTLQYNHNFKAMEDSLIRPFKCYNLACLFAMPLQLMYDFALSMVDEDDYVLIQLHETQAARTAPISSMAFAYLEGDLDRFLLINYQNHKKYFLNSFGLYKNDTLTMQDQLSYEYFDSGLLDNGDYIWQSDESKITDNNKGSGTLSISSSYIYGNFEYLTLLHAYHNYKNTLLTFDTYNKNAIDDLTSFYNFENLIKANFKNEFSIISDISDSVIEGKYFRYEDNIHLNTTGGNRHCAFIANAIDAALSN